MKLNDAKKETIEKSNATYENRDNFEKKYNYLVKISNDLVKIHFSS